MSDLPTNTDVDFRVRVVSLQNQPSSPSPEVRGHTKCSPPESPPHGLRLDSPSPNEVKEDSTDPYNLINQTCWPIPPFLLIPTLAFSHSIRCVSPGPGWPRAAGIVTS